MKTVRLLEFDISSQDAGTIVSELLESRSVSVVNTLNVHSFNLQRHDEEFNRALKNSAVLIPDGSGITMAARLLDIKISKLSGYDFFFSAMGALEKRSGKVFFLGSTEGVIADIKKRSNLEFPHVEIEGMSPPFQDSFTKRDVISFADVINRFEPDILFVGLTAPKQEKLSEKLRAHLSVAIIANVGAVFDFYSRNKKRPNSLFIRFHLEWLGRLISDPRKIYKRVFLSLPIFLCIVFYRWLRRNLR